MDCKTSSALIMNYVDKTIREEEWANLQEHMKNCGGCQQELQLFTEMLDLIEEIPLIEPSENFENKIMESIDYSLYTSKSTKPLQLSPLIFSLGIYLTYIIMITQQGLPQQMAMGGEIVKASRIIQRLSLINNLMEKLIYPQIILKNIIRVFSWNRMNLLFVYTLGLFTLVLLLTLIKTTLSGLLEKNWRRV